MVVNKAIKAIMKSKRITSRMMAAMVGKKSAKEVQARLSTRNMTVDSILDYLSVMGYELVIQEKRAGKRREDQIVVDHEEE